MLMKRLAKAIDASLYLLGDLRNFNGEKWTVRYPHIRAADGAQPCKFQHLSKLM
jgi:mitofusin